MTESSAFAFLTNSSALPLEAIPFIDYERLINIIKAEAAMGKRLVSYFASAAEKTDFYDLYAVLADDEMNCLQVIRSVISGGTLDSITPYCPQAHMFEREISEQFGITLAGHPWFKPLRYHKSFTGRDAWHRKENILPGVTDFYRIGGEQIHEVGVGPVHAGVIEPGHFRFQCHGEQVFHLEIALGYQHRGIEKAMIGSPHKRSCYYAETAAGDTTIGHTAAYAGVIEALCGTKKTMKAQVIIAVALELERLANHTGDLGALSGDIGFLPTAAFCGRIRGDYLNLTALLCGSRFGRGLVVPGGSAFDIDRSLADEITGKLKKLKKETAVALDLLFENQSVLSRFEGTGILESKTALDLGIVGPAARACGINRDTRLSHPDGIYRHVRIPAAIHDSCDVFARALVRKQEIFHSIDFISEQLESLPAEEIFSACGKPAPDTFAVSMQEGWRGEICHVALTGADGVVNRYKITDPSFHNWAALAIAMRNEEISDFPLCNKSFNLSYCGHDL